MEKFRDLPYVRPDVAQVKKDYLSCVKKFKKAASFEEADAAFREWQQVLDEAMTQRTIAHVRNTMNMKDEFYDGEMQFFNTEIPKLMMVFKKGTAALLERPPTGSEPRMTPRMPLTSVKRFCSANLAPRA